MSNEEIIDEALLLRTVRLSKGQIQYTDTSNAERLLKNFGDTIRYCNAWKKWLLWDGTHWKIDDKNTIYDMAKKIVRGMYEEMMKLADYRDRLEFENHAMKSEAVRRRKALIEAATWEQSINVTPMEIDTNDWLFNVRNGTIDLKTGDFLPHTKEHLISKIANVNYDPTADCPTWYVFLREIMDCRKELMDFLQKAAGWALTGDVSEQTMFMLYGTGANGKSTFLNTIMDLIGDYGISTPTETFMKKQNEQLSNDIARLKGTRYVTTIEAEEGKKISEPLIKQITGNDRMTARFLYGEFFDFMPTFKIFMATNHKPMIRGTDNAIWRRIRLIPFTVTIPPEKQDKQLTEKLKAELPGILNWMIEGYRKWQEEGLLPPKEILEATTSYRDEMDVIGSFLRERCIQSVALTIRSRELFKAYQEWCDENNERACSERYFGFRLQELGLEKTRTQEARYWRGIGLKTILE